MGYIMHLRKKIGHEELLTAGTGFGGIQHFFCDSEFF